MKPIRFELERFLRWLGSLSADELRDNGTEISEAANAFADNIDTLFDDDSDNAEQP